MKIIQNAAIGVLLFTSVAVKAQAKGDTAKSEAQKKEYKSKEWKQGDETITDTVNRPHKQPLKMQKKSHKLHGAPPPPPPLPPALPNADPAKP